MVAGWLLGAIAAALLFGTAWRRVLAIGALVVAIPVSFHVDLSGAADHRGYSTESRFANYDRAVGRTLDHNPIRRLGVKPREQDNHIAVGSHSTRSEEHTSELQSLMRISYAGFCLKK